jgi:hypothetical protein
VVQVVAVAVVQLVLELMERQILVAVEVAAVMLEWAATVVQVLSFLNTQIQKQLQSAAV